MPRKRVGKHLIVNVYDVPDDTVVLLERMDAGRPLLDGVVHALDFHVVSQTGHAFEPVGWSYAYVLSESHFTIHTYPEHRSCYIDMFCCNSAFDPERAVALLREVFQTQAVESTVIHR